MSKYPQSLLERTSEIYLSKLFLKKNTGEGRIVENTGNWLAFLLLGLWDRGRGGGVNSSLYLGFNDFKCCFYHRLAELQPRHCTRVQSVQFWRDFILGYFDKGKG